MLGRLKHYLGITIAAVFVVRLCLSAKNIILPVYREDKVTFYTHKMLDFFGRYKEEDKIYWEMTIQYLQLLLIFMLIVCNVRSFLQSLLRTLKNLLRDQMIQIEAGTTLLAFAFFMGAYYLGILLQLSMNLPRDHKSRQSFGSLVGRFEPTSILYTFDCSFVIATSLSTVLLVGGWYIRGQNKVIE